MGAVFTKNSFNDSENAINWIDSIFVNQKLSGLLKKCLKIKNNASGCFAIEGNGN